MKNGKRKVIILGAGLAGLSAGFYLAKRGCSVTILEARSRVGGRVDTRTVEDSPELTIEMGGEWIGVHHHHIRSLCRELRLKLISHRLRMSLLYDGKYLKPRQWKFSDRWKKKLKRLAKELATPNSSKAQQLDTSDWWHYLVANHVSRRDLELIDLIGGTDSGEDIRFVSMLHGLADALDSDHDSLAIKGGNSQLPKTLAEHIGDDNIKLDHRVVAVHQSEAGVNVDCANGESYQADVLICTLPAPAAATIKWHPRLPDPKQAALATLDYCRVIKIALVFTHRFWPEDFQVATDTLAYFIFHATQNQPGTKGVLTAYATGDRAYVLSNMTDQEKIDAVCQALKIPFGDMTDKVEAVYSYYWTDDPYAGGAYALFEKGDSEDVKLALREQYQCVYFAGEHTADAQGYMEGAVESGKRAASAILASSW